MTTSFGRLHWGSDPATNRRWAVEALVSQLEASNKDEVSRTTKRILERGRETLGQEITPVAELNLEGLVSSDPKHIASQNAVKPLPMIYVWAFSGMISSEPEASQFRNKAISNIIAWVDTYVPTGNPINEHNLIPLLFAIDLERDSFPPDQKARVEEWLASMVSQSDAFFGKLKQSDTRLVNNWNSWRLALRGIISTILGDPELLTTTRNLVAAHLQKNLLPDGSSYDFHQRDALHYHIYDLEALIWLDLFCPDSVSAEGRAAILKGVEFIKPYFAGEKVHMEFLNSPVPFDAVRRKASEPDFANAPWKPEKARNLLRLASANFPQIRSWTSPVEDEKYDPMIKHIAALHRKAGL